jgi:thioredoxin 1
MDACVRSLTEADFDREVLEHRGDVLVDFYTTTCPPCRMMAPVLEDVCGERRDSLKVVKVNADENISLAVRHSISAVPTFFLFRNGRVIAQSRGASAKKQFENWIDDARQRASQGESHG